MSEEKKGLFGKLFGKKEEAEEVIKETAKDVKSEAGVAAENAKRVAEAAQKKAETEARKAEYETKKVAAEAEAKLEEAKRVTEEKLADARQAAKDVVTSKAEEMTSKREEILKDIAAKKAAAYIEDYTVQANDTLSHIAMRFYGKATAPYYTLIYDHNKDVIGPNMNMIQPGQVLRIPTLPEELK